MRNTKLMAMFLWTATLGVTFFVAALPAGAQAEAVLHSFNPGTRDGLNPQGSLIFDNFGNLYGTTYGGGVNGCFGSTFNCGTVFELSPTSGDGWAEKILHNFGRGQDGSSPSAGLVFDASGNLYGATDLGGAYGYGIVFELSPSKDGSRREISNDHCGVGSQAVGFAVFFHHSTWRSPGIYLEDLYVRHEFRKRGIGTALLAQVAHTAREDEGICIPV